MGALCVALLASVIAPCSFGANIQYAFTNISVQPPQPATNVWVTLTTVSSVNADGSVNLSGWPQRICVTNTYTYSNQPPGLWLAQGQFINNSLFGPGLPGTPGGILFAVDGSTNTYPFTTYSRSWSHGGINVFNFANNSGIALIGTNGFIVTKGPGGTWIIDGSQFIPSVTYSGITNGLGYVPANTNQTLLTVVATNGGNVISAPYLFLNADTNGAGTAAANASTNVLGGAAYKNTNAFDLAGTGFNAANQSTNNLPNGAFTSTNQLDLAGAGTAAAKASTNNLGSGAYVNTNALDLAGSAVAAYSSAVTAIQNTNQLRINRENYILAQNNCNTNFIMVYGGTGSFVSLNGTNLFNGSTGGWTNINNSGAVSAGGIYSISGVSVAGVSSGFPVGTLTNITGSGTLPTVGFATNGFQAGSNITISQSQGTFVISSTGGSGSASSNTFSGQLNFGQIFPAADTNGAGTAAANASTNALANGAYTPTNKLDMAGAGTAAALAATNPLTQSAYEPTNTWDLAGAAAQDSKAATNPLTQSAYEPTNTWDLAGAGAAAANAATSAIPANASAYVNTNRFDTNLAAVYQASVASNALANSISGYVTNNNGYSTNLHVATIVDPTNGTTLVASQQGYGWISSSGFLTGSGGQYFGNAYGITNMGGNYSSLFPVFTPLFVTALTNIITNISITAESPLLVSLSNNAESYAYTASTNAGTIASNGAVASAISIAGAVGAGNTNLSQSLQTNAAVYNSLSINGAVLVVTNAGVIGVSAGIFEGTYVTNNGGGCFTNYGGNPAFSNVVVGAQWDWESNGVPWYFSSALYGAYAPVGSQPTPYPVVTRGGYTPKDGWISQGGSIGTNATSYIAAQISGGTVTFATNAAIASLSTNAQTAAISTNLVSGASITNADLINPIGNGVGLTNLGSASALGGISAYLLNVPSQTSWMTNSLFEYFAPDSIGTANGALITSLAGSGGHQLTGQCWYSASGINGLPGLYFDGTGSDILTNFTMLGNAFTNSGAIMMTYRSTYSAAAAGGQQIVFSGVTQNNVQEAYFASTFNLGGSQTYGASYLNDFAGGSEFGFTGQPNYTVGNDTHIFCVTWSSNVFQTFWDGKTLNNLPAYGNNSTWSPFGFSGKFSIGCLADQPGIWPYNGYVGDFILWTNLLPVATIGQATAFEARKYGLQRLTINQYGDSQIAGGYSSFPGGWSSIIVTNFPGATVGNVGMPAATSAQVLSNVIVSSQSPLGSPNVDIIWCNWNNGPETVAAITNNMAAMCTNLTARGDIVLLVNPPSNGFIDTNQNGAFKGSLQNWMTNVGPNIASGIIDFSRDIVVGYSNAWTNTIYYPAAGYLNGYGVHWSSAAFAETAPYVIANLHAAISGNYLVNSSTNNPPPTAYQPWWSIYGGHYYYNSNGVWALVR